MDQEFEIIQSKSDECSKLIDEIQVQRENANNFKNWINDPEIIKLNTALANTSKRLEDSLSYYLPEEVKQYMEAQRKTDHSNHKAYAGLVATQDKIIQLQTQLLDLENDIIKLTIKCLTGNN